MSARSWDEAVARERIDALASLPGATLPILHALQEEFGYIDKEAIPLVADALNLSRAEVVGVLNFYHDYRQEPPAAHALQICRAEACQSMSSDALVRHIESSLQAKLGESTADGAFSLDAVYCLGNCALSPALMLDGRLYGRVSPARADAIIEAAR